MKKILSLTLLLLWGTLLHAQDYHAIVLKDKQEFRMASELTGKLQVSRVVCVQDEEGLSEGTFRVYTGAFEKLTAFKGSITYADGRTEQISKGDLLTLSLADGLADDEYVTGYVPSGKYPFTVSYDYTVEYRRGIAVFPLWAPVVSEKTRLLEGSYTVRFPDGYGVNSYSVGLPAPVQTSSELSWTLSNFVSHTAEHIMPEPVIPRAYACPIVFTYDKNQGMQDTWENLGTWESFLLLDLDDLSDATRKRVHDMTDSCTDELEKIRILYEYLRTKTRYVSIQLGIGGFRPFKASVVDKTGFGDCKALSFYMSCLLREAGIESYYTVLNTKRKKFFPGYPSFGQTDHVMLSVPLKSTNDTLYIECTNPDTPLGYRHEDIAGHDVLVIADYKGHLVEVPSYPDSLRRVENRCDVQLHANGSADLKVTSLYALDEAEPLFSFRSASEESRITLLSSQMDIQTQNLKVTGIRDNFKEYDGPSWYPVMEIDFSLTANTYARSGGDRIFVPVNSMAKRLFYQRGERINPIETKSVRNLRDIIVLHLPDGYSVESLPAMVERDEDWGRFHSDFRVEDRTVVIDQSVQLKKCTADKSRYPEYRDFARTLNKAYGSTIVLKRD